MAELPKNFRAFFFLRKFLGSSTNLATNCLQLIFSASVVKGCLECHGYRKLFRQAVVKLLPKQEVEKNLWVFSYLVGQKFYLQCCFDSEGRSRGQTKKYKETISSGSYLSKLTEALDHQFREQRL